MKKILAFISFLTIITSCSSDDELKQLPLTMSGSNSVEYTFNGKRMSSFDSDETKEIQCSFNINTTWIHIKLGKNDIYSTLTISANTLLEEGKTYQIKGMLNSNVQAYNEYYGPNIPYVNCGTNNEIGGTITIAKLDYTNKIITGTFSYYCVGDKGVIYTVRDGWFDLKF